MIKKTNLKDKGSKYKTWKGHMTNLKLTKKCFLVHLFFFLLQFISFCYKNITFYSKTYFSVPRFKRERVGFSYFDKKIIDININELHSTREISLRYF
jgi:hypothetical protein